jgi:UDP-N-acetylglucosamine acyltransferase
MVELAVMREIDPAARIAPHAKIGPYCVVGPHATIGPGTVLARRVCVLGRTTIGSDNVFDEGCVLGAEPQDLKYQGGPTLLVIGHRNRFGRGVTAHIGTEQGGFVTRIGDDNALMDGCHVAHDCYVDNRARLGRSVLLAGHVRIHTGAVIEDMAGLHHFTTIGWYARVGPRTPVRRDVPPYTDFYSDAYDWSPPSVRGIHEAGLVAAGLGKPEERELRHALRDLFEDEAALQTKIEQLANLGAEGEVAALCDFCQRSLQGVYGRFRELYRGKAPPEAYEYLPPERRMDSRRPLT